MHSTKQETGTNDITLTEITNAAFQNVLGRQMPDNCLHSINTT